MSDKSNIEWTDATWNPVRGCSRVSEGCRHCYAEGVAARFSGPGQAYEGLATMTKSGPRWTGDVRLVEKHLEDPLRWKKPRRIFVNSMSDLFHEGLSDEDIDKVFAVMALCPQHTFQVLTKRAERMRRYFERPNLLTYWCYAAENARLVNSRGSLVFRDDRYKDSVALPLRNAHLGVSVEDQRTANERLPEVLATPAAVRWVSYEPALGSVDFTEIDDGKQVFSALDMSDDDAEDDADYHGACIDWIVCGGESGPGARPMHPAWPRSVRDQCVAAGVKFFFKQWGAWVPYGDGSPVNGFRGDDAMNWSHFQSPFYEDRDKPEGRPSEGVVVRRNAQTCIVKGDGRGSGDREMVLIGKKAAGRLLDGREWNEFPA